MTRMMQDASAETGPESCDGRRAISFRLDREGDTSHLCDERRRQRDCAREPLTSGRQRTTLEAERAMSAWLWLSVSHHFGRCPRVLWSAAASRLWEADLYLAEERRLHDPAADQRTRQYSSRLEQRLPWDATPILVTGGSRIAFYGDRVFNITNADDNVDICVMQADGSSLTRLTEGESPDAFRLVPDGARIVFYSERDGDGEIYA